MFLELLLEPHVIKPMLNFTLLLRSTFFSVDELRTTSALPHFWSECFGRIKRFTLHLCNSCQAISQAVVYAFFGLFVRILCLFTCSISTQGCASVIVSFCCQLCSVRWRRHYFLLQGPCKGKCDRQLDRRAIAKTLQTIAPGRNVLSEVNVTLRRLRFSLTVIAISLW